MSASIIDHSNRLIVDSSITSCAPYTDGVVYGDCIKSIPTQTSMNNLTNSKRQTWCLWASRLHMVGPIWMQTRMCVCGDEGILPSGECIVMATQFIGYGRNYYYEFDGPNCIAQFDVNLNLSSNEYVILRGTCYEDGFNPALINGIHIDGMVGTNGGALACLCAWCWFDGNNVWFVPGEYTNLGCRSTQFNIIGYYYDD